MAAGFKTATVNASDVPATQTDFPAYVNLSRLGITTLAEAQSVRVYADSGKTTEWAREIVSVDEMHVKIPSLTSTTSIYVDWDGSRADYAVTDTFGRNNVWTGYDVVMHGNALTDSTGKHTPSQVGTVAYGTGKLGNGFSVPDTANYPTVPDSANVDYTGDMYYSAWLRRNDNGNRDSPFSKGRPWDSATGYWMHMDTSSNVVINRPNTSFSNLVIAASVDFVTAIRYFVFKKTAATNMKVYLDGALHTTTTTNATAAFTVNADSIRIGNRTDADDLWDGIMDEVRFSDVLFSDNWITTEYNNQSDEPGFWGTWTTVGGGGATVKNTLFFGSGL